MSRLKSLKSKITRYDSDINQKDLKKALKYIDSYWSQLEFTAKEDDGSLIGLPYPYMVPSDSKNPAYQFKEQYYWDSYFISLGLDDDKHKALREGMLENLLYMYRRFGLIPNASRMYFTGRSQPPLLTSFILHVYKSCDKSLDWLASRMEVAKDEYQTVWMSRKHPKWHNVFKGLSRYYDINVLHDLAEAESGWDMTPRFERKCLDFLPVDLNAMLYKYEMDLAYVDKLLGDDASARRWRMRANKRKKMMDKLMWGKLRGFYFDYNYQKGTLSDIWSLASYYTMWAGMANEAQAAKLVKNLPKFVKKGGLTTTSRPIIDTNGLFGSLRAQWAYPNGWAPLQYIVVEGLKKYGYQKEAEMIARSWIASNLHWFNCHGSFLEKYNVVNPKKLPVEGVYPTQEGFGWTNAIFIKFVKDFAILEKDMNNR